MVASKLVVFDAAGTLIKPVGGVIEIYHSIGQQYGSQLSVDQVRERFRKGRWEIFRCGADLRSSEKIEHYLWQQLVGFIFNDVTESTSLFETLWTKFAQVDSWAKFDDVDECLCALLEDNITCVIGSNFDSRLLDIADSLFGDRCFAKVYCSSLLGYRKPSPHFYQCIADQYPEHQITMIGDDRENDVLAPQRFGWDAIHIDRRSKKLNEGSIADLRFLQQRFKGG